MEKVHNLHELIERRRFLRRNATSQERRLWHELRNKKLGYKFRRQHSIGYYIADFYCYEKKLIIELDGDHHSAQGQKEYDDYRDSVLGELGCVLFRIKNEAVDRDVEGVLMKIQQVAARPLP